MKITTVAKGSILTAALGIACLMPAKVYAQIDAAPDPDSYAFSSTESAPAQTARVAAKHNADFAGKFSLPYDVQCSGKSLKAGQYQLSVRSQRGSRIVTIQGNGSTVKIEAREIPATKTSSHNTLLVRNSAEGRRLQAVYVEGLNATLYLEASTAAGATERLPIS